MFKLGLVYYTSRSKENSTENKFVLYGPSLVISEGTISKWPGDHSCDILARNLVVGFLSVCCECFITIG